MSSVLALQWSRFTGRCLGWTAAALLLASANALPTGAAQDSTDSSAQSRVRYMLAGAAGTKARNLPDAGSQVVLDVAAGGVLAVYGERAGWSEVEAPGGFRAWVFGEYLRATSETGVLEVSASGVNQRPAPSSGAEAYPLKPTLARGARLRFVQRQDERKPFAEDWIQVYSAPGTRAWVPTNELAALGQGQDGAALWAKAIGEASARPAVAVPGAPLAAGKPTSDAKPDAKGAAGDPKAGEKSARSAPEKAREMIRSADEALERERARLQQGGAADFAGVRTRYEEAALYAGADADLADTLRNRLAEVDTLADAYELRREMERKLAETEAAKAARDRRVKEAAAVRDIYAGRFDARGWVEQVTFAGQAPSYRLRYGGEVVAEIVCNSGRLDLDVFLNYDVGVAGVELRRAEIGETGIATKPRVVDVRRLEVISGRASR